MYEKRRVWDAEAELELLLRRVDGAINAALRRRSEELFETGPQFEVKTAIDDRARQHILDRVRERYPGDLTEQARMLNAVKNLLGLSVPQPVLTSGHYPWYVDIERGGQLIGRVVFDGYLVRTVLSPHERYPANATPYVVRNRRFVRA